MRQIAVVMRDPTEMHRALRERAEQLDISREAIDEMAGLPKGYAAKLLCEPPVKQVGPVSLFPLAGALGLAVAFIEDEQRKARISRATKRKPGGPRGTDWRSTRALEVIRKWGYDGGKKRFANMSPEEIKAHQSRAGKASARKAKQRRKLSAVEPQRSTESRGKSRR